MLDSLFIWIKLFKDYFFVCLLKVHLLGCFALAWHVRSVCLNSFGRVRTSGCFVLLHIPSEIKFIWLNVVTGCLEYSIRRKLYYNHFYYIFRLFEINVFRTCTITDYRKGKALSKVSSNSHILSACNFDIGFYRKSVDCWVLWYNVVHCVVLSS